MLSRCLLQFPNLGSHLGYRNYHLVCSNFTSLEYLSDSIINCYCRRVFSNRGESLFNFFPRFCSLCCLVSFPKKTFKSLIVINFLDNEANAILFLCKEIIDIIINPRYLLLHIGSININIDAKVSISKVSLVLTPIALGCNSVNYSLYLYRVIAIFFSKVSKYCIKFAVQFLRLILHAVHCTDKVIEICLRSTNERWHFIVTAALCYVDFLYQLIHTCHIVNVGFVILLTCTYLIKVFLRGRSGLFVVRVNVCYNSLHLRRLCESINHGILVIVRIIIKSISKPSVFCIILVVISSDNLNAINEIFIFLLNPTKSSVKLAYIESIYIDFESQSVF